MTTPRLYDLSSAEGLREIVAALCLGYNYRLYTEGETRNQLLEAYRDLITVLRRLPTDADYTEWMDALRGEIDQASGSLEWWLLGLGKKTADNLGITRTTRLEFLEEVAQHLSATTEDPTGPSFEDAMLMLWAGAATLTVRGSRKSTAGKTLERAFLRSALTILGLEENTDFWLNMERDAEVPREIDAEIASRRGRIRVEMGLIGQGNQEVIEDKITRVGTRGMVIFDRVGPRSNAHQPLQFTRWHSSRLGIIVPCGLCTSISRIWSIRRWRFLRLTKTEYGLPSPNCQMNCSPTVSCQPRSNQEDRSVCC